jgi:hypothetical protein
MKMHYLIYISTAVNLMSEDELTTLLNQSRRNNHALKVTGMLLYAEGTFLQALEGDEAAVNKIYAAIQTDTRHKNLVKIISGELDERAFPNWSMAFSVIDHEQMEKLDGYVNPSKTDVLKVGSSNTAISILKTFAETNNFTI